MEPVKVKTCPICHKEYKPRGRQVTCGSKPCRLVYGRRYKKAYRKTFQLLCVSRQKKWRDKQKKADPKGYRARNAARMRDYRLQHPEQVERANEHAKEYQAKRRQQARIDAIQGLLKPNHILKKVNHE